MSVEAIRAISVDGDVWAQEGESEGVSNTLCYRCGQDPEDAHDHFFCPAFSEYSHAGMWLSFSRILQELRRLSPKTISIQKSCNVEELEGRGGQWHHLVGISIDGCYTKRMDAPECPEFGIYDRHRGLHRTIYAGWRSVLKDICLVAGVSWRTLAKRRGVNPDRCTEEIRRMKSGFS